MSNIEKYTNNQLVIEVEESKTGIEIRFKGKSTERDPGGFISPVLQEAFQNSKEFKKGIVVDFQELEYMNSSTITPVIRMLERAAEYESSIHILYKQAKKWQELCFSALRIFETEDHRIEITGK